MLPQDPPADGLEPLAQLQRMLATHRAACRPAVWLLERGDSAGTRQPISAASIKEYDAKRIASRSTSTSARRCFRFSRRWRSTPAIPSPRFHNRGLYLAAHAASASAASAPRSCSPSCKCRRCCRGSSRSARRQAELRVARRHDRLPAARAVRRLQDSSITATFRLTRDMDVNLLEQEADDMLRVDRIASSCPATHRRRCGWKSRPDMNRGLLEMLVSEEELHYDTNFGADDGYNEVYRCRRPARHDVAARARAELVDRKRPARSAVRAAATRR